MNPRLSSVHRMLPAQKLDALFISNHFNISYLTGFRSQDSYLIISKEKNIYLTDARYTEEAKRSIKGCSVEKISPPVSKTLAKLCKRLRLKRIGFEENDLTVSAFTRLKRELPAGIELVAVPATVESLRLIKTAQELEKIRKAVAITVKAFDFIKDYIVPGAKEIEVAGQIERFIRLNGAYSASFEIIVACGSNSSFPHHVTSEKRIKKDDIVLIDMGVDYCGLKSDLTRVFFLGKINSLQRRIYEIVLEAERRAIKEIKPAVIINKIDAAARQYIAKKGFGGFFNHATGHGIGLEVHEAPSISAKCTDRLKPGEVVTVEPAVYIPGKFGIRIEDMCLVTNKGAEVLSGTLNK